MGSDYESLSEKRWRLAREVHELEEQLVNTEAYRIYMKTRSLWRSYDIFESNYLVLIRTLNDMLDNTELLIAAFVEATQEGFFKLESNVGIVLHDYLAGAKTLVDHTRVFVRECMLIRTSKPNTKRRLSRILAILQLCNLFNDCAIMHCTQVYLLLPRN